MADSCEDLDDVPVVPMPEGGCVECLKIGGRWVYLRFCVECSRTHCCDSSPNRHARAHWEQTGHPVIRSKDPGETWAWCYGHELARDLVL